MKKATACKFALIYYKRKRYEAEARKGYFLRFWGVFGVKIKNKRRKEKKLLSNAVLFKKSVV
jgi:hypothetical protein